MTVVPVVKGMSALSSQKEFNPLTGVARRACIEKTWRNAGFVYLQGTR